MRKSGYTRADIDFLNMVLIKPSGYRDMLQRLGLTEEQSVYNADYGHMGEQDSIINIIEGVKQGRLRRGFDGHHWSGRRLGVGCDLRQVGAVRNVNSNS